MTRDFSRRNVLTAAPSVGLMAILAGCVTQSGRLPQSGGLYRVDDEAKILAAARAIVAEDPVGALITLDGNGVPRARSVGVSDPEDDLAMWIGTRRTSRKVAQLQTNPTATLFFNFDDVSGNFANAFYASFMGVASVHTDPALALKTAPDEETRKSYWPNFPDDYAAIRFKPLWLEVAGHGIKGDEANWQPQAVILQGSNP
jgi:general stress protein 26